MVPQRQMPSSKSQDPRKSQLPNPKELALERGNPLGFGAWIFVGIWSLDLIWDLELGTWDLSQSTFKCNSRSCLRLTVEGAPAIRSTACAVFGNAITSRIDGS